MSHSCTLRPTRYNTINNVYFWFYVTFLFGRTIAVLFSSASINESAQKPLNFIRNVPTKYWTLDVSKKDFVVEASDSFCSSAEAALRYDWPRSTNSSFVRKRILLHHKRINFSCNNWNFELWTWTLTDQFMFSVYWNDCYFWNSTTGWSWRKTRLIMFTHWLLIQKVSEDFVRLKLL